MKDKNGNPVCSNCGKLIGGDHLHLDVAKAHDPLDKSHHELNLLVTIKEPCEFCNALCLQSWVIINAVE